MQLHNTETGQKEEIKTYRPGEVNMYVCGITPYNESHIGHARCYIVFDTLRRYFLHKGNAVRYVQNYTDIDDKIIKAAAEAGVPEKEISEKNIASYKEVRDILNIMVPDAEPKVTEHIPEIIEFIQKIIENGKGYAVDGDVYISIENDPLYGKLSKKNIDDLVHGSRIEINRKKKSLLDFALWKNSNPGESGWKSPWGEKGRPGWHIECSAMSIKYLGLPPAGGIDIHGGGLDLAFPHHENEAVQSRYALGFSPVKYWVHNGFVTVKKEKMSKSLGNFFTIREVLKQYSPETLRMALLSCHYRSPFEFDLDRIKEAGTGLARIREALEAVGYIENTSGAGQISGIDTALKAEAERHLENDFNTQSAISVFFSHLALLRRKISENRIDEAVKIKNTFVMFFENVFGIRLKTTDYSSCPEELKNLLADREIARKNRDFKKSDEIRAKISALGFTVKDTEAGQVWKKK